jgi:hypothetical protein
MRYPCPVGKVMFKQTTGRCPALEQDGDQFNCGLVAHPRRYNPFQAAVVGVETLRKAALVLIGHGTGCDAQFVGEPVNQAYRDARMREEREKFTSRAPSPKFMRALQMWGVIRPMT